MKTTSRCLPLILATLAFALPVVAQVPRKIDAKSVLNRMSKVYARFESYQDEGILIITNDEPSGGTIEKMPFKTFFRRPDLFRFEWTDYGVTKLGRTKMIWFNGKEAFSYWEPDAYEKERSLSSAIAGATGISLGTVNTVSELFLPEEVVYSFLLKRLENVSLTGDDVFEGVRCYRIKATDKGDPVELWIGKTDFLMRKVRHETKYGGGLRIEEEIRRKIQVNQSIPEVVFNYNPPISMTAKKEVDPAEIEELINPAPPVWTEFRSDEGRFTLLMPDKPISQTFTTETPQGRIEQHVFTAAHSPLVCTVAYSDFPKQTLVAMDADTLFQGTSDAFIKQVGGKLAGETPLSLDGHPGREVKVLMFRGELRLRLFLVGDRLYMMSIISVDQAANAGGETFKKFFDSFKLNPATKSIAALLHHRKFTTATEMSKR